MCDLHDQVVTLLNAFVILSPIASNAATFKNVAIVPLGVFKITLSQMRYNSGTTTLHCVTPALLNT